MTIEKILAERSGSKCELCSSGETLSVYPVPPDAGSDADRCIYICSTCLGQIEDSGKIDPNHWRCLNDSMWSPAPAVQVMAWRMLKKLSAEAWAQDLLDILYLDEETKNWAEAGSPQSGDDDTVPTLDCHGAVLNAGDTVTIIKDLEVKGAGFTAKRGTAVRNIALTGNPAQIEGRVNGTRIVLLTCYLKKAN